MWATVPWLPADMHARTHAHTNTNMPLHKDDNHSYMDMYVYKNVHRRGSEQWSSLKIARQLILIIVRKDRAKPLYMYVLEKDQTILMSSHVVLLIDTDEQLPLIYDCKGSHASDSPLGVSP